jgi:hypothetical protein
MTRLIQAQSKLSKETQNNPTTEHQHRKLASEGAITVAGVWTTRATTRDLPLRQTTVRDHRNTEHHQPRLGNHVVALMRQYRKRPSGRVLATC